MLTSAFAAKAQEPEQNSSYNESVIVVGDFKPEIGQSFKLNVAPSIVDTAETMKHNFVYNITPTRCNTYFQPSRIKAAKIVSEAATGLYNNYLRMGMGNYWSPLFDAYYNSTRSKNTGYGLRLYHNSSWGTIGRWVDTIPFQSDYWGAGSQSQTDLSAFFKYIVNDRLLLTTDLLYENDYHLLYGFSDSTLRAAYPTYTRDSIAAAQYGMMWNYVGWNGGAKSIKTDVNKLGYEANAHVGELWGNYGQSEFDARIDGHIHYGFPMFKQYKGIVTLRAEWEFFNNRFLPKFDDAGVSTMPLGYVAPVTDSAVMSRNIARINPYADFLFKGFQFHVGALVAMDAFTVYNSKSFDVFPDVSVSKTFMNEALNVSLGAVGNIDANTWNSIRLVNPYVGPNADLAATSHYDFYGHVRFNFSKKIELNAHAEYNIYDNALGFCTDRSSYLLDNVMTTTYADYNRIRVGADLALTNDELLQFSIGGNYYNYIDLRDSGIPLLYLPDFDAHIGLDMKPTDKLRIHAEGLLLGRMYSDYTTNAFTGVSYVNDTLPMRIGVNLEAEYLHTRALSFFAKFDNITAQRYFYWKNYPSRRFQFMLGMTYTIPTKRH